jgi:hypothetical protein
MRRRRLWLCGLALVSVRLAQPAATAPNDVATLDRDHSIPAIATVVEHVPGWLITTGDSLNLWDPVSGATVRLGGGDARLLATHGSRVAWAGCDGDKCGLHIVDTATWDGRGFALPAVFASFSADGRSVTAYSVGPCNGHATEVKIDVARGTVERA